jgi:hypothetical protein
MGWLRFAGLTRPRFSFSMTPKIPLSKVMGFQGTIKRFDIE